MHQESSEDATIDIPILVALFGWATNFPPEKKDFGCLLNHLVTAIVTSSSDWNMCPFRIFLKGPKNESCMLIDWGCRLDVVDLPIFSVLTFSAQLSFFFMVVSQPKHQQRTHFPKFQFLPKHI